MMKWFKREFYGTCSKCGKVLTGRLDNRAKDLCFDCEMDMIYNEMERRRQ